MEKFKSFRVKIFLLLLTLTVATISVFSVIIMDQMTRYAKEDAYKKISNQCVSLVNQIELHLEKVDTSIYQLAVSGSLNRMNLEEFDQMSQALIRKMPMITQIYIMDKYGMQIYKSSFPETMGDRSDRDYFIEAITGKSVFSEVLVSRSTAEPIVVHAQPIIRNGKVEGVIGASIDLSFLSQVAMQITSGVNSYGFIVDGKGKTIGHPNLQLVSDMLDLSYLDPVKKVMSGKSGTSQYTFEGSRKLVAYMPFKKAGWGVLVQTPETLAFNNVELIRSLLIITAIGLTLASIIGAYSISNYLEKPIDSILIAIKRIEKGSNFSPYCSIRNDEFGIIENALVAMADTVNCDKIELEERVNIRTHELQETMNALTQTQNELLQSNESLAEAFENLKIAQIQKTQVEKMAALDRVTSSLAHGLNTPLGAALTTLSYVEQIFLKLKIQQDLTPQMITELNEEIADVADGIQLIRRQLAKAIELIKVITIPGLMENSNEKLVETDFYVYLTKRLIDLKLPLSDTKHSLVVEPIEQQCFVHYPDVLFQILTILVTNAVEHGFSEQDKGEIRIFLTQENEVVRITLQNNGKQISESVIDHIFEHFYKERMSGQGRGLGLTIAYTLVEKFLDGRISCRNLDPVGVEFIIEIPSATVHHDSNNFSV